MNHVTSQGLTPRMRPLSSRKSATLSILDVGTSKVVCLIAELNPAEANARLRGRTHVARIIGIGHQKSRGVKNGVIADLDAAESVVRLAVDAAERMAGLVGNLLDMARLHAGDVTLQKEWQPIEEVIGSSIKLLGRALAERGQTDIKFVCYDRIPETLELLRKRIVNFTITQDPFMQGYQPVKILFDALFNGTPPESEHIRTRIEILTAENI